MKTLTRIFLCAALLATAFVARAERIFNQAELDALLAPVALYPDAVLHDILEAASYPDDVREAAAWSRGNPHLRGEEAQRLVENLPWHPSVKSLVAMPEVLARMDESPQWLLDLGEAYRVHGPYVMDTVQGLRQRAQANGHAPASYAPAPSGVVYVRYYDPYVVYGPWWWPAYRPVVWRPFVTRVVVHHGHSHHSHRSHYRHHDHRPAVVHKRVEHRHRVIEHRPPPVVRGPVVVQKPVVQAHVRRDESRREHRDHGRPAPSVREQQKYTRERQQERRQHNDRKGGHRG